MKIFFCFHVLKILLLGYCIYIFISLFMTNLIYWKYFFFLFVSSNIFFFNLILILWYYFFSYKKFFNKLLIKINFCCKNCFFYVYFDWMFQFLHVLQIYFFNFNVLKVIFFLIVLFIKTFLIWFGYIKNISVSILFNFFF